VEKTVSRSYLGVAVMLGSVWGLSEAALGMGLRSCASLVSGSLMTGVALFFISAGWVVSKRVSQVVLLIIIASLIKMFDALLLSLPIRHGAVANPIFAFFMEGVAFLALAAIIRGTLVEKKTGQAILGGGSALVAVGLFPLVRFATGIPACVYPGTRIPLSFYFSPVAVALSVFTVPLGFWAGEKFRATATGFEAANQRRALRRLVSPATFVLCLAIVALIRLV
jgi:hypothetical protein